MRAHKGQVPSDDSSDEHQKLYRAQQQSSASSSGSWQRANDAYSKEELDRQAPITPLAPRLPAFNPSSLADDRRLQPSPPVDDDEPPHPWESWVDASQRQHKETSPTPT